MKITINTLTKSEIEVLGVMEMAEFEKYEDKALAKLGERLELDGFRKGKVPAAVVRNGRTCTF
jgi:FKBP-type peptidyl-prolyl cis-trans isomerase (trigger factor)